MKTEQPRSGQAERKPSASRRLVIAAVGACLILAVTVALYKLLGAEPTWNDKRLSSWLNEFPPYAQQSGANSDQAEEAVRAIGAQAIPFLLGWIKSEDNSAKKAFYELLPRNLRVRDHPQWAFDRWWSAAKAFTVLGTNAEPAVSELSHLLGAGKRGQAAAASLAGIGESALPTLGTLLLQGSTANDAAYGLTRFGAEALPALIFGLTNSNPAVRQAALAGVRFCVYDQYIWKDADLSRSSSKFNATAIGAAIATHAGREQSLLGQTLGKCLSNTNQEVVTAARLVEAQLGL